MQALGRLAVRVAGTGLATIVFIALLVGTAGALSYLVSHTLLSSNNLSEEDIDARFMVMRQQPASDAAPPYRAVFWRHLAEELADNPGAGFHLSARSWDAPGKCCLRFDVLEEAPDRQLVEVFFSNSWMSWSRYRVEAGRIIPVSFRWNGALLWLPYLAIGFVPAYAGAIRCRRWFHGRFENVKTDSSA